MGSGESTKRLSVERSGEDESAGIVRVSPTLTNQYNQILRART